MTNRSRAALLEFLDYLSNKGLMNRTTVAARKAAANKILGILDDAEAADVAQLDIDVVMGRFLNLEGGKYTPESLSAYKSRLKSAIDDFLRYQKDPLNFKPSVSAAPRKPEKSATSAGEGATAEQTMKAAVEPPPADVNIIPIPLRPNLTIKIQGLPFDLSGAEANKIANVIRALANED
ncbi:hypothetical protein [Pseudorhodoplanes sp.]|uniref:hypothetical protein n=1 Tax=Pseudorhodoplanes sp. TaxID=1934341 RepID=UPI00391C507E